MKHSFLKSGITNPCFILLSGAFVFLGMLREPLANAAITDSLNASWWPAQEIPKGFVNARPSGDFGEQILLQGLAGLAAQGVNERRGDELVWLEGGGGACYADWKKRTVSRAPLEDRGEYDVWKLLKRYQQTGLVKGYVLYGKDTNPGAAYSKMHDQADLSLNVATTLASLVGAVPVEAALEPRIQSMGLQKLGDGRTITPEALLKEKGSQLGRQQVVLLDPKAALMRDFAIAHRAFVDSMSFGVAPVSLAWAAPLTPVIGWFCGDEFRNVAPVSRAGHMHTASNWATNIPFLSMGSAKYQPRRLRTCDAAMVDWKDSRPCVAFMMSDGDNVCWMLGGFQALQRGGQPSPFWDSPEHGKFPMGWSACLGDLADIAPVAIDRLAETQPQQTSVTQFGGGYFYPDLFAADCPNRVELIRKHAQRIAAQMRRTGAVTLTFICEKSDSPAAQEAMQIFAQEIQPLLGMLVMDYAPYNRMQGAVYWIPDGRWGEVPAATARYSMWAGMKKPRAGNPAEVAAAMMQDTASEAGASWVAVHAWSKFESQAGQSPVRGIEAVAQCIKEIDQAKVHLVTPEEMLWRLRYQHDPVGTRKQIAAWNRPVKD